MVQLPGVDVNAANAQGWTALHVAASLGHFTLL
jgi:ankyrin repeat protein